MFKTIMLLMTFLITHASVAMDAGGPVSDAHDPVSCARNVCHENLLGAARSGNIDLLKDALFPTEGETAKYVPTEYEMRELVNAAFVNKRSDALRTLLEIPSLPCPVDLSDPLVKIATDDIFAYNICTRTAFCHIETKIPNCNIYTTDPITYAVSHERWQFIFEFFKIAEQLGHTQLTRFIVQKSYAYNASSRPAELQAWVDFMLGKANSEVCPTVAACLTAESLEEFKAQYSL